MAVLTQIPEQGTTVFYPTFGPDASENNVHSFEIGYWPTMVPDLLEAGMLHDSEESAAAQAKQMKLIFGDKLAVPALLYPSDSYISDVMQMIVEESDANTWARFSSWVRVGELRGATAKVRDKRDVSKTWTLDADVVRRGLRMVVDARYNVDNVEVIMSITEDDAGYIDASLADEILQYGLFGEIVYS